MSQAKRLAVLTGAALSLGATNAALAEQTNDDVRAIVAEMMADAETRSSLLAGGDAGHDGKFFIAGDGFRLNVGGMIQFRYLLNFRDDNDIPVGDDDLSNGFQNSRSKIDFSGSINRDWDFRVLLNFAEADSSGDNSSDILEEAWGRYNFSNGLKVRWGQFKLPMLREELISDSKQLAVERSLTNLAFTQNWSQGIELSSEYEQWRWAAAFSDGLNSLNTPFNDAGGSLTPAGFPAFQTSGESEYAFTARGEYMFSGNWAQFDDFTSNKGSDFGGLVGLAGHWQSSTQTPNVADVDIDTFQITADVSLEGDSWNLYGAFVYRYQDFEAAVTTEDEASDFGAIVQGGWRFAENTEVFARWDAIFADDDRFAGAANDEDNFNFITFGFNQYYAGHAAKATIDAVISLNETTNLDGSGLIPNNNQALLGQSAEGEVAVRLQMQLLF